MVRRVPKVTDIDQPDKDADDSDDLGKHLAEVVELTLQGRLLANLRRDGLVYIANSGLLAGEYDNSCALPIDNGSTLQSEPSM